MDFLKQELKDDVALVSVMLANNETGVLQPLAEISKIAKKAGVIVHSDAVQAVGKVEVDVEQLGVDLLSFTGHKFGAVKGIGALYVRDGIPWRPMFGGSTQELGKRAGTEAVHQIIALAKACFLKSESMLDSLASVSALREEFESEIKTAISGVEVNGSEADRLPNTTSLFFDGVLAKTLVESLAERGVFVSTGAACKSGDSEPSHVLKAMGCSTMHCLSSIRVSFGDDCSRESLDALVGVFKEEVEKLRSVIELEFNQIYVHSG